MFGLIKTKNLYLIKLKRYEYTYFDSHKKVISFSIDDSYYAAHLKKYTYSYNHHYSIFKLWASKTTVYASIDAYHDEVGDLYAVDPIFIGDSFKSRYINKNTLKVFVKNFNNKVKEEIINGKT